MSVFQTKMASTARTWVMVNRHIPMIKFRKAGGRDHGSHGSVEQPTLTAMLPTLVQPTGQSSHSIIIEDWQLSGKYKRKPISQEEIDYINMGGPQ